MELEVALEPRRRGEAGLVQRLDGGEVRAVRGDLLDDGVVARVTEPGVLGVDAEVRREDRVVDEQAPDPGLDEVVQAVVEGSRIRGRSGSGSSIPVSRSVIGPPAAAMRAGALRRWERAAAMSRRCPGIVGGQAALGAGSPAGCGAVSASAPATAWIVRSMSCAEIP